MVTKVLESYETNDTTYEFTAKTFTKTSRLPFRHPRPDGSFFMWFRSWNHDRITNEAEALSLVAQRTTIPVPKLYEHGVHPDGRRYLMTEFIEGVPLSDLATQACLKPAGQRHADSTPCATCSNQAYANAIEFIQDTVLPQLATLTSQTRGLNGFVMPPAWLAPDVRPPWKGKKSWDTLPLEKPDYVFQHGDIAAHNIMMDPQTLKPKALFDWEYAGYFPPGMERWSGSFDAEAYRTRGNGLAEAIARFLPAEYLECYDGWEDKAQLAAMIESGDLPHPDQLRS